MNIFHIFLNKFTAKYIFKALISISIVYLILVYVIFEMWFSEKGKNYGFTKSSVLPYVIVHLDLKGAPPKITYLKSLLPLLKQHGANGLLIEYEDMFPYEEKLVNLSAVNCYNKIDLRSFLSYATQLGFEIVPLLQTFGHMEFVLKLEEFRHLRENPAYPDSICPSNYGSGLLISQMIQQVMDFHNNISRVKFIHIGCDEVYHMSSCDLCLGRAREIENAFLEHVITTSDNIKTKYPNTTVLIWDDMLRTIDQRIFNYYDLRSFVEPVYWDYNSELKVTHINLYKYHRNTYNTWIASAYKGADGKMALHPNVTARFVNHYNWMNLVNNYRWNSVTEKYNFRGIILTGWSRYSHFSPLCELLPVSVPSLLMNLLLIDECRNNFNITVHNWRDFYDTYVRMKINRALECTTPRDLNIDNFSLKSCYYSEIKIYFLLYDLYYVNRVILDKLMEIYISDGDIQEYYIKINSVNPTVLDDYEGKFISINKFWNAVETKLVELLRPYYDDYVIDEFVRSKMEYQKNKLNEVLKDINEKRKVRVWQRRYSNTSLVYVTSNSSIKVL